MKKVKRLTTVITVFALTLSLAPVYANENTATNEKISVYGQVMLDSEAVLVEEITFDEMIERIADYNGQDKAVVVADIVAAKKQELNLGIRNVDKHNNMVTKESMAILSELRANSYLEVQVGVGEFPVFKNEYQPSGLRVYGEGFKSGVDHIFMNSIMNVVFMRNNIYKSTPQSKQFSGHVYTNLEASDRIYYSVDGTFYNNGETTVAGSTGANTGLFDVNYSVSYASSYYADIDFSGRWYGV